jgi:hypothetical protein
MIAPPSPDIKNSGAGADSSISRVHENIPNYYEVVQGSTRYYQAKQKKIPGTKFSAVLNNVEGITVTTIA